jgi:hypothetical protein
MLRAFAVILMAAGLAGCSLGVERGTGEGVTLTHYGVGIDEVAAQAERWCGRFDRRAHVVNTERLDNVGLYYRTTFTCVGA